MSRRRIDVGTIRGLTLRHTGLLKRSAAEAADPHSQAEIVSSYRFALSSIVFASIERIHRPGSDAMSCVAEQYPCWLKKLPTLPIMIKSDQAAIVKSIKIHLEHSLRLPNSGGENVAFLRTLRDMRYHESSRLTPQELLAVLTSSIADEFRSDRSLCCALERQLQWLLFTYARDTEMTVRAMKLFASFQGKVDESAHEVAFKAAMMGAIPQMLLAEAKQRKAYLTAHPLYSRESFETEDGFRAWAKAESGFLESDLSEWSKRSAPKTNASGVLSVRILGLRGSPKEINSPFCKVKFGGDKKTTRPLPCKIKEPFWGDEFHFIIGATKEKTADVTVSAMETESVRNRALGKATISVDVAPEEGKGTGNLGWVSLRLRKSGSAAPLEVLVETSVLPFPSEYAPVPVGHVLYKIVVRKLLEHDQKELLSASPPSPPAAPATPPLPAPAESKPNPLVELALPLHSALSRGIARDCSIRYGVQRIAPLINLGVVARALEIDASRLMVLAAHRQLDAIRIHFQELTRTEAKYFHEIVAAIQGSIKPWIVRYFIVLPENTPAGVLDLLVELCVRVASLEAHPRPAALVEQYLRESAMLTVQMGLTATGEAEGSVRSCENVTALTEAMMESVARDREHFSKTFSKFGVNVLQIQCEEYSNWLGANVPASLEPDGDPVIAMTLYLRLREISKTFEANIPGHVRMALAPLFEPHLLRWLASCEKKFVEWMGNALKTDTWTPASEQHFHSSSVVDLFSSIATTMEFLDSLGWAESENPAPRAHFVEALYQAMTQVVCKVSVAYSQAVCARCLGELSLFEKFPVDTKQSSSIAAFQSLKSACVGVSNLDSACVNLDEFLSGVESRLGKAGATSTDNVSSMISGAMVRIRDASDKVIEAVVSKMQFNVRNFLSQDVTGKDAKVKLALKQRLLSKAKKIRVRLQDQLTAAAVAQTPQLDEGDPLFNYLNFYLEFVTQRIFLSTFKRFLRKTWDMVVFELQVLALGKHGKGLAVDLHRDYLELMELLGDFFVADGDGLRDAAVEPDKQMLSSLVSMCPLDDQDIRAVAVSAGGSPAVQTAAQVILKKREATKAKSIGGVIKRKISSVSKKIPKP